MQIPHEVDPPAGLTPAVINEVTRVVFATDAPEAAPGDLLFMFGTSAIAAPVYERCASWISDGWFDRVLVTGKTGVSYDETGVPLAHSMRDGLTSSGVDRRRILVQDRSTNTFDDVRLSAPLLADAGLRPTSMCVVAKSHHMGRCLRVLETEWPEVSTTAAPYDHEYGGVRVMADDWVGSEPAARRVWAEYLKITTYPDLQ